jgi:7,8-dihydropterin-6-yl-methyl-4-(beta-D-ribofuranosyl)aminobenzene 5'-phosphate synthase
MRTYRHILATPVLLLLQVHLLAQEYPILADKSGLTGVTPSSGITSPVTIRVIYDNYVKNNAFKADWGYSIIIEGTDKTVLFDTGTKPKIFESNFKASGADAANIDCLVLSHEHGDHVGGIPAFVKMKTGIPVIMPYSFTEDFKRRMGDAGLKPVLVKAPAMICEHLYSSGEFTDPLPEQALVLDTKKGLVVMTGCSHPGIINMIRTVKTTFNKNVYMVFGGFHLLEKSEKEMNDIIAEMKALGVTRCGATHCTGDKQIAMFREAFGNDYFELGAGNKITISQ